jgi:hypothetical protein
MKLGDRIPERKNLKREEIYSGSLFLRFQSMANWLCYFRSVARQKHGGEKLLNW